MHLTPEFVADVLQRQGMITPQQALQIKKESKLNPEASRGRSARSFEQRALTYELIEGLRLSAGANGSAIGEHDIARALAAEANLPHVRIDSLTLSADLIESKMSRPFARRHRMIPLDLTDGRLRVACANPFDIEGLDHFRRIAGRDLEVVVASEPEVLKAITEFYGLRHAVKKAEKDLSAGIEAATDIAAAMVVDQERALARLETLGRIEPCVQFPVGAGDLYVLHRGDVGRRCVDRFHVAFELGARLVRVLLFDRRGVRVARLRQNVFEDRIQFLHVVTLPLAMETNRLLTPLWRSERKSAARPLRRTASSSAAGALPARRVSRCEGRCG